MPKALFPCCDTRRLNIILFLMGSAVGGKFNGRRNEALVDDFQEGWEKAFIFQFQDPAAFLQLMEKS